ncbi:glycosyltransferase family protein [Pseudomonas fulva]|uniref:Spore protein YkvP/CgeB glycosyl transferase-like domain-containing protein n=1 Tax=Pseudomonas fulva (strain 12-X) TaxID=743720 RepID=F6AKR0_PSEF1|nr:glycosyltransferase [Pseudomonas fulva]AEF24134.1 hypothetical protein Psefu_4182 [Pseudomonas fulva 12-X]
MRVLILATATRQPDNHLLWKGLEQFAQVELVRLDKKEQKNLDQVLRRFDLGQYDRIILDLLFRHISRQVKLLARIPGLVLYEEDACQEFLASSKWRGHFSDFYRKVPHARVIFTGYRVSERFKSLGVDACFLPKGYDSAKLYDMTLPRDIQLGFIGRLGSDDYQARRAFLERAVCEHGLQMMRTEPGDEYRYALNRMTIFLSADIGLGEYMAKNFEAIACGCVLIAYRQGQGEEEALGFIDGENVLLYEDYEQFCQRLDFIIANPAEMVRLKARAAALARQRFDYLRQAESLYALLRRETRTPQPKNWPARLFERLWSA